jgi:hypothetical protein
MSIPLVMDTSDTERSRALALSAIGVTQASTLQQQVAARGDKSVGLVTLGGLPPNLNPLELPAAPLPAFAQPGTGNPATASASVPPPVRDPMGVTATRNYQQPNVSNPPANPPGTTTRANPMGL